MCRNATAHLDFVNRAVRRNHLAQASIRSWTRSWEEKNHRDHGPFSQVIASSRDGLKACPNICHPFVLTEPGQGR